jgi:hypothetical protein
MTSFAPRALSVLGMATLVGCLFKPEIEDRWTRFDLLEPGSDPFEIPDTMTALAVRGRVTFRAIRTGDLIVEIRVSDSIGHNEVRLDREAPREEVLRDVNRVLAGSTSVAAASVLATGWDHLMREIDFSLPVDGAFAPDSGAAAYLLFYMGDAEEMENPDGTETTVFQPFDFEAMEILPAGVELRVTVPPPPLLSSSEAPELSIPRPTRDAHGRAEPSGLRPQVALSLGQAWNDPHLADYQWSREPSAAWSAEAGVRRGGWSTGIRASRWSSSQAVAGADPAALDVTLWGGEWTGSRNLISIGSLALSGVLGLGVVRIGYSPDRVDLGEASVAFRPAVSWLASAGLAMTRPIGPRFALGLSAERQAFALDTAHRRGEEIVLARETFHGWSWRGKLSYCGGEF